MGGLGETELSSSNSLKKKFREILHLEHIATSRHNGIKASRHQGNTATRLRGITTSRHRSKRTVIKSRNMAEKTLGTTGRAVQDVLYLRGFAFFIHIHVYIHTSCTQRPSLGAVEHRTRSERTEIIIAMANIPLRLVA